jgi:hypothetical protein
MNQWLGPAPSEVLITLSRTVSAGKGRARWASARVLREGRIAVVLHNDLRTDARLGFG